MTEGGEQVRLEPTAIPGLLRVLTPVHRDSRGWFKENWQRRTMVGAGLPDFGPVQHNVSFNDSVGVTRGLHAEPWDKYVSVASGRVFGAWVDLREGVTFGTVVTGEIGRETAYFVPRGVANGYQTLEPGTAYTYLVNDHWSAEAKSRYTFLDLADPEVGIAWPVDLASATVSAADRGHPRLADVAPVRPSATLVLGAGGQLGRALVAEFADAEPVGHDQLDLTDERQMAAFDWSRFDVVINAAAYTDVDGAEGEGRRAAWDVNVAGLGRLVEAVRRSGATLVHVSSDYVYGGTAEAASEDEPLVPLNVYGATKAAGDVLVARLPRHYVLRTSWLVGDGPNFVRTMAGLAGSGAEPAVVHDQVGRITACADVARAARHLLERRSAYGTYHVSCSGPSYSWAELAERVFRLSGRPAGSIRPISTSERLAGLPLSARRPSRSVLDLARLQGTGFTPRTTDEVLAEELHRLKA